MWAYLKRIDSMGGSIRAIERGFFQSEIRRNAYRLKKEIDGGERVIVGVNRHADESEESPDLLRVGRSVERRQRAAVRSVRRGRDAAKAESALSALAAAADTDANLMPFILEAALAHATTGEISGALRSVFGEYRPREVF